MGYCYFEALMGDSLLFSDVCCEGQGQWREWGAGAM